MIEPYAFRFSIALTLSRDKFSYLFDKENLIMKSGLPKDHTWALAIFIINFAEYQINPNLIQEFRDFWSTIKRKRDSDVSDTSSLMLPVSRISLDNSTRKIIAIKCSSNMNINMKSQFGNDKMKNENYVAENEEKKNEQHSVIEEEIL